MTCDTSLADRKGNVHAPAFTATCGPGGTRHGAGRSTPRTPSHPMRSVGWTATQFFSFLLLPRLVAKPGARLKHVPPATRTSLHAATAAVTW